MFFPCMYKDIDRLSIDIFPDTQQFIINNAIKLILYSITFVVMLCSSEPWFMPGNIDRPVDGSRADQNKLCRILNTARISNRDSLNNNTECRTSDLVHSSAS